MGLREDHAVAQHKSNNRIHFVIEIKFLEVPMLCEEVVNTQGMLGLRFDFSLTSRSLS